MPAGFKIYSNRCVLANGPVRFKIRFFKPANRMSDHLNYKDLRELMVGHFSLADIRQLCFDLDINYDELSGDRLSGKVIALIDFMSKRGQMAALLARLAEERPQVRWPARVEPAGDTLKPAEYLLSPTGGNEENPFGRTGKIRDPAAYLVRQPLTTALFHELKKGVSLSIVGPSQTGKSSLLWYLTRHGPREIGLPADDFLYLSMELIHDETDFFDYICSHLEIETTRGFRLARRLRGRKIILCLDEIEKMAWDGFSLNVRTELRGLADGQDAPFTLVIASRSPLGQLFPDSPELTSPLAGLCMQVDMPPFSAEEAHALADLYLAEADLKLSAAEIQAAWATTAGHPRQVQAALRKAYDRLLQTDAGRSAS